jgi:hypothetical protein
MNPSTYTTAGEISAEIDRRVKGILLTNGCETNIGRDVSRGKRKMPGEDVVPCAVIIEGDDSVSDRPGRMPSALIQQAYIIDGFDKCDPDHPNDKAHMMIRDIKRAIFAGDATLGGKVQMVKYMGRDIGPRPDGAALVQARVLLVVTFAEDLTNP